MDSKFPLRHISIRVPWHDSGWAGCICQSPQLNGACAKLKGIAALKSDGKEIPFCGQSLQDISPNKWPCCVDERGMFMAPFEMEHEKRHKLAELNPAHYGHFKITKQRFPAWSAGVVPFRWLLRENFSYFKDLFNLNIDIDKEPDLGYDNDWITEGDNQKALLECFAEHLREQDSLCLFYAKHVPFSEGTGRILIGAGRIKKICPLTEFKRKGNGMRGMVWERPIQHSIRPKGKDGFLIPYYETLQCVESDTSLDIDRYVARVPDDHWNEFSYASELITHDGAIAALLSLDKALNRMELELGILTGWQRSWLNDELVRLWKVRGPFPGLGAVLSAFGLSRGIFVAHALQQKAGENVDPWPLLDSAFTDSSLLPKELRSDFKELAPTWKKLPSERRAFLRLLSRFELTAEQAKSLYEESSRKKTGWGGTDREILENPYRIFELSRHDPEGIKLLMVDRGIFPEDAVRLLHPLDELSRLDSAVDLRRVRAFLVSSLEESAKAGHTLLSSDKVLDVVHSFPVRPECPITGDLLSTRISDMAPEIVPAQSGGDMAIQLQRYKLIGELVRKQVNGRVSGARHTLPYNWLDILDKKFGKTKDPDEKRARTEKAAALKELAEARFSILAGPAGAGKTTILGILCAQSEIRNEGLLLLAPTGKARVRMQELAGGNNAKAFTVAQFLNQYGRYNTVSARYVMGERPKAKGFGTVIVDEASMLTEDMLGALFDAFQGVNRFIFVGDPAQLPPIGAGRPFVDIVAKLRPTDYEARFPRVANGYAELTIERRQVGSVRPDLRLARWFSSSPPSAGEDDIFTAGSDVHPTIRFFEWQKPEDFPDTLAVVLKDELKLADLEDTRGFNERLGATTSGDYDYFNATRNGKLGAVALIEEWQILSPLRGMPFGVNEINRQIHDRFRAGFLKLAGENWRSIPKPMGPERIVYGDKVMNLSNHRRDGNRVYPQECALGYLANGEIGIVVGLWQTRRNPKILKIEFSSQKGFTYDFYGSDFREEGDAALELAYALTVHKAQGSQFKLVILVLPEGHPIMSRELIYTALTRHQARVVVMHQGPRTLLKEFTAPHRSETARRMTNLMRPCHMLEFPQVKGSIFLQEGLIHRASTGIAVRSKSELLIYEELCRAGYRPEYEKPLTLSGSTRYPDFTIEDEISGRNIYWEHLGLLEREDYLRSWEAKRSWYRRNKILPIEEGGGAKGTLVTTTESSAGGFDLPNIQRIIRESLNG